MSFTFVGQTSGQVTNNSLTLTLPSGIQGQDVILIGCSSLDNTVAAPAGYTELDRQVVSTMLGIVETKIAAGSAGSGSTDASASVALNVALTGQNHKTSGCAIVFRGANPSASINAEAFTAPATGGTSFTGPSVTTTADNCEIVSIFMDKDSTNPLNITVPSGYTSRSTAVFTTGSGKANCVIATKDGGSAGNYGADTWTTDAIPGSVAIFTVALAPASSTQIIRPMGDITVTNAAGNPTNTAGNLYTNLDEAQPANLSDWVEIQQSGVYTTSLTSLNDPGVDTGFSVQYTLGLGAGATTTDVAVTLLQNTTSIETWTESGVTVDGTDYTHALSSTNVASIVYTTGSANNLRLKFSPSTVA